MKNTKLKKTRTKLFFLYGTLKYIISSLLYVEDAPKIKGHIIVTRSAILVLVAVQRHRQKT